MDILYLDVLQASCWQISEGLVDGKSTQEVLELVRGVNNELNKKPVVIDDDSDIEEKPADIALDSKLDSMVGDSFLARPQGGLIFEL